MIWTILIQSLFFRIYISEGSRTGQFWSLLHFFMLLGLALFPIPLFLYNPSSFLWSSSFLLRILLLGLASIVDLKEQLQSLGVGKEGALFYVAIEVDHC